MAFTGTKTGYVEPLRRRGGHGTDQPDVESQPDDLKKYIAIEKLHSRGAPSPIRATIKQDIRQQQKTRRTLSEVNE